MPQPIDRTQPPRPVREEHDDQQRSSRPLQPQKPSVADAWAQFEATGDWTRAYGAPDADCADGGIQDYDQCMDNADDACSMFPHMGTVAGAGIGRMAGRSGAWLGGVAGKYIGDQMKDQCFDVAEVQCRQKEANSVDACMQPRIPPAPRYVPEDFPVVESKPEPPVYHPEDFPVVRN